MKDDKKDRASVEMLLSLAEQAKTFEEITAHHDLAAPGSDLAADDKASAPFQTSHLVAHCLSVTSDHYRAVRTLLASDDPAYAVKLSMVAHYPLLRSAVESSAMALWLLRPEDPRDRLIRLLRARWAEFQYERDIYMAMSEEDPDDDKEELRRKQKVRRDNAPKHSARMKSLRAVAQRSAVERAEFEQFPRMGPLVRDAALATKLRPSSAASVWQLLSSVTHPSVRGVMAMSDLEVVDNGGDVLHASITTKPAALSAMLVCSLALTTAAYRLTERRGGRQLLPAP